MTEKRSSAKQETPKESHVRWFGRSHDDPNRLLIIEDDQCRVFLDAEAREELYSVLDIRNETIYEMLKFFKFSCPGEPVNPVCDMCGANQYCIELRKRST